MDDTEIRAVEQAITRPAQRLIVALAAVHAARWAAIRDLTLDDLDLPSRRITIAGHDQRLGDLSHQALRAWLDHRRTTWPHTPNRHVLISKQTALGGKPVSKSYLNWHLQRHGVSVERIRRDRVLHEALTARADPLHLALVFGISQTTASRYALIACDLLAEPPDQETGAQHDRPRRTRVTSQLGTALRAAAAGLHPDEAGTGLIISHGTFLHRSDFTRHIETAACISDGTPMAWIDWDAVIAALNGGRLPTSRRREARRPDRGQPRRRPPRQPPRRHPRPRFPQPEPGHHRDPPRRRAAPVNVSPDDAMELGQLLQFLDDWLATDRGPVDDSLTRFVGCDAYGVELLRHDLARFAFLLGESDGEGLFSPSIPG